MMNTERYNHLQKREIFHLEFLREFSKKFRPPDYSLKGGCNLRFFFNSPRYSEDMDIEINGIRKELLTDRVMHILEKAAFKNIMRTFGISKIIPPDLKTAKQTRTTQRFKVHLFTYSGEELYTKIEFSRMGITDKKNIATISESVLRTYKIAPFIISHYCAEGAATQKIKALAMRKIPQARDLFDLYFLLPRIPLKTGIHLEDKLIKNAVENIYHMNYEEFYDQVILYLLPEDRENFGNASVWEEIQLKTINYIEKQK